MSHIGQEELTFLDLLLLITRRKMLVAVTTIICTGIALIMAFILPPEFTGTVTLLPPQDYEMVSTIQPSRPAEDTGLGSDSADSNPGTPQNSTSRPVQTTLVRRNLNDTYVSLLKSQKVEDAVIRQYGLQAAYGKKSLDDARNALEAHTKINGSTKDGLIRLSVTDRDPKRSAQIANGYIEQFKSLAQSLAISEASQRRRVAEKHLEKTKADLENAYEALIKAKPSTGAVKLDEHQRAAMDSAAELRGQIVAKEVQIEAMPSFEGDENPARVDAQAELDELRTRFNSLVGSQNSWPDGRLPGKGAAPQASLEYLRRLRDVKYNETTFDVLVRQLELARLDEAREGAFIQVVDPAVAPDTMSYPRRGLLVLAGLAIGFTLGVMLALLQGGLARMQQNPATRGKLDLLRMSLGHGSKAEVHGPSAAAEEREGAHTLSHG